MACAAFQRKPSPEPSPFAIDVLVTSSELTWCFVNRALLLLLLRARLRVWLRYWVSSGFVASSGPALALAGHFPWSAAELQTTVSRPRLWSLAQFWLHCWS
jgi:hypothetical protein